MNYIFLLSLYLFVNVQEIKGKSDYIYTPYGKVEKAKEEKKSTFQSFKDMLGRNWKKVLVGILAAGGGAYALKNHLDNNKNLILNQGKYSGSGNNNGNVMGGINNKNIQSHQNLANSNKIIQAPGFENLKNITVSDKEKTMLKSFMVNSVIKDFSAIDINANDKTIYNDLIKKINEHEYDNLNEFKKDLLLLKRINNICNNKDSSFTIERYINNESTFLQFLFNNKNDIFDQISIETDILNEQNSDFKKLLQMVFPFNNNDILQEDFFEKFNYYLKKSYSIDFELLTNNINELTQFFEYNKNFIDNNIKFAVKLLDNYFDFGSKNHKEFIHDKQKLINFLNFKKNDIDKLSIAEQNDLNYQVKQIYIMLENAAKVKNKIDEMHSFIGSIYSETKTLKEIIENYNKYKDNSLSLYDTLKEVVQKEIDSYQAMLKREGIQNITERKVKYYNKVINANSELASLFTKVQPPKELQELAILSFNQGKNTFKFNNKTYMLKGYNKISEEIDIRNRHKIERIYNTQKLKEFIVANHIKYFDVPEKYLIFDKNLPAGIGMIVEYLDNDENGNINENALKEFINIQKRTGYKDFYSGNFIFQKNKNKIFFIDLENKSFGINKQNLRDKTDDYYPLLNGKLRGFMDKKAKEYWDTIRNKEPVIDIKQFYAGRKEFFEKIDKMLNVNMLDFDKEPTIV